ncbi:MAG: hypothetical protein KAI18_01580 [Candidatus Aenigmarchaeota archaeon]|nr:hypothetical protein [Candidatus Aenigmarchaeota archaeon]
MEEIINVLDTIQRTLESLESEQFVKYRQVKKDLIEEDKYAIRVAPYKETTDIAELNEFLEKVYNEIGIYARLKLFKVDDSLYKDKTEMRLGRLTYHETYAQTTVTTKHEDVFSPEKNTEDTKEKEFSRTIWLFFYMGSERMEEHPDNAPEDTIVDII